MLKRHIILISLALLFSITIATSSFAQCTITFIPEVIGHGQIEPFEPITLNPDDCASFEFFPDAGYSACNVSLVDERSGTEVSNGAMEGFYYCHDIPCNEMPYPNWRIILRVYFCPFNIEVNSGVSGSISPSGLVKADYMSCQKFEITPDSCWHVSDVLLDGESVLPYVTFAGKNAEYTICDIRSDHEIEAKFERDICYVNVAVSAGGRIEPWGKVNIDCGESKIFRITPDDCYKIKDVLIDGESVGAVSEYVFSCDDCGSAQCDHIIKADFEKLSCDLDISSSGPGRIIMLSDIDPECKDRLKFRMIPDDCCYIKDVIVNDKSVGSVIDYEAICRGGDFVIRAIFERRQHTIKTSASIGGKINPEGDTIIDCGGNFKLNIIPDDCYKIVDVIVDGTSAGLLETYEFKNIRTDHEIIAEFGKITYTLTTIAEGNGTIEPSGDLTIDCGESQKFVFTPIDCTIIKDVLIDGQSMGALSEYIFDDVKENHIARVIFETENPIITATASIGGNIMPSGKIKLNCKDRAVFNINSDPSYMIWDVKVDGESVGAVAEYKFESVTGNHNIEAVFKAIHSISVQNTPNGAITPSGNIRIIGGETKTFKIEPNSCYAIADVLVDGNSIGAVEEYTFEDVNSDHTIGAKFTIKTYIISANAEGNGKIEPSGELSANCGENKSFAIVPDDCHRIEDVIVDGESKGTANIYKFTVIKENHAINVIFEPIPYIINATSGENGKIEPSGDTKVSCADKLEFNIKSDEGYVIESVIVDGKAIAVDSDEETFAYTFDDINADHEISAKFKKKSVTAVEGNNDRILLFGQVKVYDDNSAIKDGLPLRNELSQNYPNPFNPETWIPFSLAKSSNVHIQIFDITGHRIRTLDLGYKQSGFYISRDKAAYWDGKTDTGEEVHSGIYFYTIQAGEFDAIRKMTIRR